MNSQRSVFQPSDTAIVLVDHQPGVFKMVKSLPEDAVISNAATLARLGEQMGIPLVITTTREDMEQTGTTVKQIQKAAPQAYARRIRRAGTLNAFHDKALPKSFRPSSGPTL